MIFILKRTVSIRATISSLCFINVFFGEYGNYFGGALYFSCLVVTWAMYLIYLKYVDNMKKSFCLGICVEILAVTICLFSGYILSEGNTHNINYLCRCISSFAVANIIYNAISTETFKKNPIPKRVQVVGTYSLLYVLLYIIMINNVSCPIVIEWIFALLIILNYDNTLYVFSNPIFTYLGKRILPIFCWHLLIYTILSDFMRADYRFFWIVVGLTLLLSEITYRVENIRRKWLKSLTVSR